ncbi:hypothetical protein O3M35_001823 [Rhynocoris fuscipes]|uniref:PEHE domain-containing protein n=1 Tax=Rhynocoris fuscipes TaxID=488301 RepID=A0AAW1CPS2_9HEMI
MSVIEVKKEETINKALADSEMVSYKDMSPGKDDFPQFYASQDMADRRAIKEEELKEFVLVHLDYIEQQREQLIKRDKIIIDLKQENEMLKQQINRMERRLAVQKTKCMHFSQENGVSGCQHREPMRKSTRRASREEVVNHSSGSTPKRHCVGSLSPKRKTTKKTECKKESMTHIQVSRFPASTSQFKFPDRLMTTSEIYPTIIGESDQIKPDPSERLAKINLEVPKWRIATWSCSYTMEGTEDLSDNVFDRRHFRRAIDEKRRKRWDVQRIRELRHNERLREREERKKRADQDHQVAEADSNDRLTLCNTDRLPISVFGVNVPRYPIR